MINKAIIMGRLTRDPEIRTTSSGKQVTQFTVAVENGYGENKQTAFINCVAWNKQAEFVEKYFTKGMMIIVIGRIQTRSWDGQDGKTHYATEVVANEVSFGETKAARERYAADGQQPQSAARPGNEMPNDVAGDLPFTELEGMLDDLPDDLPY